MIDILKLKYCGPTATRGSRFKVCSNHHMSAYISYDYTAHNALIAAVEEYCRKRGINLNEIVGIFSLPGNKDISIVVIKESSDET
jgi:hypothetical protein